MSQRIRTTAQIGIIVLLLVVLLAPRVVAQFSGGGGLPGPQGVAGVSPSIWVLSGTPTGGMGADGDMFVSTSAPNNVYSKSSGSWGASLGTLQGATGATGPAGSANNVQFTSSVTVGTILSIGGFTRDITVNGILATDQINVMPTVDFPAGVILINGRPTANNSVRLYFNGLSLLTNNTPQGVAITAMR